MSKEIGQRFRVAKVKVDEDDQAMIKIAKNRWTSPRTKSVDIRCHWLRAHVLAGNVEFVYCSTNDMMADALTKVLSVKKNMQHFEAMGMKFFKLDL
jgi:hypothetical protein